MAETGYARGGGPSVGEIQLGTGKDESPTSHEDDEDTAAVCFEVRTVGWPSSVVIAAVLGSGELLPQRQSEVEAG